MLDGPGRDDGLGADEIVLSDVIPGDSTALLSDHAALIPLSASCDIFPLALIGFELFRSFGSAMERAKLFGELRGVGAPTAPPPAVTKRKGGVGSRRSR